MRILTLAYALVHKISGLKIPYLLKFDISLLLAPVNMSLAGHGFISRLYSTKYLLSDSHIKRHLQ